MANKQDACSGSFWESRFRSVAVLDEESLLATAAYIALNPVAAAMAATPESSQHTSLHERIEQYQETETLETIRDGLSSLTSNPAQDADLWLLPVEDLRASGGLRAGMAEGCTTSSSNWYRARAAATLTTQSFGMRPRPYVSGTPMAESRWHRLPG